MIWHPSLFDKDADFTPALELRYLFGEDAKSYIVT